MQRFAALESAQVTEVSTTCNTEGVSCTSRDCNVEKQRSLAPGVSEPASVCQEAQEEIEEASTNTPHLCEDPCRATTLSGEFAAIPGTETPLSAWPWASGTPVGCTTNTSYTSMSMGLPTMARPYANPHFSGWGMPYVAPSMQPQPENPVSMASWPYSTVPNSGYNTVPLGTLPYGDYSMLLGGHVTPATKEKIGRKHISMCSTFSIERLRRKS